MRNLPRITWVLLLIGATLGCDRTIHEVRSPASTPALSATTH